MRLPYSESSVFLVPLRNGGFARGVVARAAPGGKILLGYFFGPRLVSPSEATLLGLDPLIAVLCVRFGDLGLINGEWPIYARVPSWDRAKWTIPEFLRQDPIGKKAWRVRYSDIDPSCIEKELPAEYNLNLARDSLSGYGAVEIKLTKILG